LGKAVAAQVRKVNLRPNPIQDHIQFDYDLTLLRRIAVNQADFRLSSWANGLRYWQVSGHGEGSGAEKLEARQMLENGAELHLSSARFVR
jgi:hypothetical protein